MQCDWKSGSIDEMKSVGEDCECKSLDRQTTVKATAEIDRVNRTSLCESARKRWFSWAIIGRNGTEAVGAGWGMVNADRSILSQNRLQKVQLHQFCVQRFPRIGRGPFVRHGRGRGNEARLVQNGICGGICSQIPYRVLDDLHLSPFTRRFRV